MKRFFILTVAVGVGWGGHRAAAGDLPPLPLPTGMAPTAPRIPVPTIHDGIPTGGEACVSCGPVGMPECVTSSTRGPRLLDRVTSWSPLARVSGAKCEPYDPCRGKSKWCEECAPAVRHPLPTPPQMTECTDCGGSRWPAGRDRGACWDRFQAWLCYHPSKVWLGLKPTPRHAPLYTFPCHEKAVCAGGGCMKPKAPALPVSCEKPCRTCQTPGETVMPGYRLAQPTQPAVKLPYGKIWYPPQDGAVVGAGYSARPFAK